TCTVCDTECRAARVPIKEDSMSSEPVLIIGGNGKTGSRVDALLRARGIATRPVSRSTPNPVDWQKPAGWSASLDGVRKAYVTFQPDLAVEGSTEAIAELARQALGKGVEHMVLLSGRNEPGAQRAEAALQMSGLAWTNVRASWFDQNFSEGYLLDGVLAGEISLPAEPVPEPFIDIDDIADVVVAALTDNQHIGKVYELTGPEALTFAQAVALVSEAIGRPISFSQITPEEFAMGMREAGEPEEIIALLHELFTVVLDGRSSNVMHGVEEALGRPARCFADYARRTAATGVWRTEP
ncbi:MAG: NmrA family NAD(P)-binding protein, partial [Usitatibacteraceae bacterium]